MALVKPVNLWFFNFSNLNSIRTEYVYVIDIAKCRNIK